MSRQIFVNLPVRHLPTSVACSKALGFGFDRRFTDENATGKVVADGIHVMALVESYFQGITATASPTRAQTELPVCLSCESDAEVDGLVARTAAACGRAHRTPRDHGFMHDHGFEDPDDRLRELAHMRRVPA